MSHRIIPRTEWGARHGFGRHTRPLGALGVVLHHTAGADAGESGEHLGGHLCHRPARGRRDRGGRGSRRRSLGVSAAVYEQVRAEVNRLAAGGRPATPAPAPARTVAQMATEVIAGRHGTGHAARQRSLGIDTATYALVRAEVNRRLR